MTLPLTLPLSLRGTSEHLQMPDPLSVCAIPFRAHRAYGVDPVAEAAALPRRLRRDTRTTRNAFDRVVTHTLPYESLDVSRLINASFVAPIRRLSTTPHRPGEVAASFGLVGLVSRG
jgi:hypothetical protein